jgi:DNA-binding response OmpR family regulator
MATILIIEDDKSLRNALNDVLRTAGYQTLTATDGRTGLEMAIQKAPDLILCDIKLPYLDGYRVLEQLRAEFHTALTPFIFLTALHDSVQQRRGMLLGADDYVTKPFEVKALLKTIQTQFEKRERFRVHSAQQISLLRHRLLSAVPAALRTRLRTIDDMSATTSANSDKLRGRALAAIGHEIHHSAQRVQEMIENYLLYVQLETIGRDERKMRDMRAVRTEYPSTLISATALMNADKYGRSEDLTLSVREISVIRMATQYLNRLLDLMLDYVFRMTQRAASVIVAAGSSEDGSHLTIYGEGPLIYQMRPSADSNRQSPIRALYGEDDGLAVIIARRIVELHQGQMDLLTDPAQGIRVSITLP